MNINRILALSFVLFFSLPGFANAQASGVLNQQGAQNTGGVLNQQGQPGNQNESVTLINPLGTDCSNQGTCLEQFLNSILKFVVRIGTVVVIVMLVYVGFLFVAAQGNETKITQARTALLWTVIGALILLGAEAISLGIEATVQAISSGAGLSG